MSESPPVSKSKKPGNRKRLIVLLALAAIAVGFTGYVVWWDGFPPKDEELAISYEPDPTGQSVFMSIESACDFTELTAEDFYSVDEEVVTEHRHGRSTYLVLVKNEEAIKQFVEAIRQGRLQVPQLQDSTTETAYLDRWLELVRLTLLQGRHYVYREQFDEGYDYFVLLARFGQELQRADGGMQHVGFGLYVQRLAAVEMIRQSQIYPIPTEVLIKSAKELNDVTENTGGISRACKVQYAVWSSDVEAIKARTFKAKETAIEAVLKAYGDKRQALRVNKTRSLYAAFWKRQIDNLSRPFADMLPVDPLNKSRRKGYGLVLLNPNYIGEHLYWQLQGPFARLPHRILRGRTEISAAQLVMGLRAFWGENGAMPEDLDSLTPKYLDAVPEDCFDGKPIRYDAKRKIIYTVGEDLIDSGGTKRGKTLTVFTVKQFWLNADPTVWLTFGGPEHKDHEEKGKDGGPQEDGH